MNPHVTRMSTLVKEVAEDICNKITKVTGDQFLHDNWQRTDFNQNPGGGGTSRIIKKGKIIESGAVNTSHIYGEIDPNFAKQLKGSSNHVEATGVSLIFHPTNPHVPSVHMNFRCISQGEKDWFGGGADLTPFLPNENIFQQFHRFWAEKLHPFGEQLYPQMKQKCDEYFYLPHREEMRGIGGIFYDHLAINDNNWNMVESLARGFIDSYLPILESKQNEPYTEEDREFQLYRRGRYVEFNLVYDRGTTFGLRTRGRIESILSSLPPVVHFEYNYQPRPGSPYEKMTTYYQPQDWTKFQ